ncbi:hypothetical protein [Desulforhopalus singaporensis]|uniref:DNA-binding protein n=1 Tax=Desulforhopalus singaporensis TaxID=91360 RepID=A0A1H0M2Y9_9BACT|nr:hypothetical protein [Desulforhopalus singaporensis]SDO74832.1 hypothetical protein SAMN05660330_00964 [Desulforhopalus singaporensis]
MQSKPFFSLLGLFFICALLVCSPHLPAAAGTTSTPPAVSGKVTQTMNVAGYTYMLVDTEGGQNWVAIPESSVAVGDTVRYKPGMVMDNFTSKTLNRTFDTITFSDGLEQQPAAPLGGGEDSFAAAVKAEQQTTHTAMAPSAEEVSGGSVGAIVPFKEIHVDKSVAPNGYSVEEIFAKAEELSGQKVRIKGKVVKFSPMIMGRNWVHLQDGTGDPMHNTHDLVITTAETVELNSTVTLEGVLSADKDFGAGYKYEAIVEHASVIK